MNAAGTHRSFFPGLNGLRAIAALCVLIQHTGIFLGLFGFEHADTFNHFLLSGHESVLLFFVLSGFLITYLLLQEQAKTQKINLKNFYRGRVLRIVPLYLLTVAISIAMYFYFYGLIPGYHEPVHPVTTFMLLLTIPNVAALVDNTVNAAGHLWSLGVENQFYLIWPLLLTRYRKSVLSMMIAAVFIKLALEFCVAPFFIRYIYASSFTDMFSKFLILFPIESMIVGGIGAWLVFHEKTNILNIIYNPIAQLLTYLAIFWIISRNAFVMPHYLDASLVPLVFLSLILNVSCNPRSFFKFQNPLLNYLGKISYGIYMFHPSIIFLIVWFADKKEFHNNGWYIAFIYTLALGVTIAVSGISFKYFESPIMQLKRRKTVLDGPPILNSPVI